MVLQADVVSPGAYGDGDGKFPFPQGDVYAPEVEYVVERPAAVQPEAVEPEVPAVAGPETARGRGLRVQAQAYDARTGHEVASLFNDGDVGGLLDHAMVELRSKGYLDGEPGDTTLAVAGAVLFGVGAFEAAKLSDSKVNLGTALHLLQVLLDRGSLPPAGSMEYGGVS